MHDIVVDVIMNSNVTSLGDLPDITILALQLLASLTHSLSINHEFVCIIIKEEDALSGG